MSQRADLNRHPGDYFQDEFLESVRELLFVIDWCKQALPDETTDSDSDAQSKRYAEYDDVELFRDAPGRLLESIPSHISVVATSDALESIDGACDLLHATGDATPSADVAVGKVMLSCRQGNCGLSVSGFHESQLSWRRRAGTAPLERARLYVAESQNTSVSATLRIQVSHRASQASDLGRQIAQRAPKLRRRG